MRQEFWIKSTNKNNELKVYLWKPENSVRIRGILQISHGMLEHMGRYEEFAKYLNKKGYIVVGNDHLGHGYSVADKSEYGYFPAAYGKNSAETAVADLHRLTCIMKRRYPEIPYFLLGHSMGSFFARQYSMTYGNEIDGLIIMATGSEPEQAVRIAQKLLLGYSRIIGEKYRSKILNATLGILFNRKFRPVETASDWLSRDKEKVKEYRNDPLCMFKFTLNGFMTLFETLDFIQKKDNISKIPKNLPIYMTSGSEDPLGQETRCVREIYSCYKEAGIKEIQGKIYPGARHEILHETNREEVYFDIAKWLEKHL